MNETQQQVIEWLARGRVGRSSKCMAMWLAFGQRTDDDFGPAHPYDPDDLDRCLRLLAHAPGLRENLPKMAERSPTWAALVARWDEIEASHIDEVGLGWTKARSAPRTYVLMKQVLGSVRHAA